MFKHLVMLVQHAIQVVLLVGIQEAINVSHVSTEKIMKLWPLIKLIKTAEVLALRYAET